MEQDNTNRGKRYITTAISYTNGEPHIGHLYEFILADVINRYSKLFGYDTYFLTGTDEHGQKIADSATAKGMTPLELCDMYSSIFKGMDNKMKVSYDQFIRTSDKHHHDKVNEIFKICSEKGDIYLGEYVGWYNVREETFVTDNDAKLSDYKDPVSGKPLVQIGEPSHFFRLSKYQEQIIEYLEKHLQLHPPAKKMEILERLRKDPLKDLSITRKNITWGIPVRKLQADDPEGFVFYVWFDALSNYISALDMPTTISAIPTATATMDEQLLSQYWHNGAITHIIGKDILWFHSVIWIAMLLSLEVKLPETIHVHNFVCDEHGQKMSKSIGNVINPADIMAKYPVSAIRYYFMKSTGYDTDLSFSEKSLADAHDSELLNKYGNLYNRVISMIYKGTAGVIGGTKSDSSGPSEPLFDLYMYMKECEKYLDNYQLAKLTQCAMSVVELLNQSINDRTPWKMDKDTQANYLKSLAEGVYYVSLLLYPIIPDETSQVIANFGYNMDKPVRFSEVKLDWNNLGGLQLKSKDILFKPLSASKYKA